MNQALVKMLSPEMRRLGRPRRTVPSHGRTGARRETPGQEPQPRPSAIRTARVPDHQYGISRRSMRGRYAATEASARRLSLMTATIVGSCQVHGKQNTRPGALDWTRRSRTPRPQDREVQIPELVPSVSSSPPRGSGSNGVCSGIRPFGVIGIITPVTHACRRYPPTRQHDRAGNSIVANPHPKANLRRSRRRSTTARSRRSTGSTT